MKRLLCAVFLGVLFGAVSIAAADTAVFNTKVVCDMNEDGFWGGTGDGHNGNVQITSTGALKFKMDGLPPHETFYCELLCTLNGIVVEVGTTGCGTTTADGKANFNVKNFVDPAILCRGPVIRLFSESGECDSGYGSGEEGSSNPE